MTGQRKMTDGEFQRRVKEVGYVEASVESARRDGGVFDEAVVRLQATAAERAFARYMKTREREEEAERRTDVERMVRDPESWLD